MTEVVYSISSFFVKKRRSQIGFFAASWAKAAHRPNVFKPQKIFCIIECELAEQSLNLNFGTEYRSN